MPTSATVPQPSGFAAEEYVEGEATVLAVNRTDRKVMLQNAEGQTTTVQVPADVNLNRVKAGDNVLIGIYQSVSARVLPPGSAPLGNTLQAASTQPGQPAGRAWGEQLTVVAEITAIDLVNHTVTLRGAEGNSRTNQEPADAAADEQPSGGRPRRADLFRGSCHPPPAAVVSPGPRS